MIQPFIILLASALPLPSQATAVDTESEWMSDASFDALTELSIEELLDVEVVTVSRKSQRGIESPAAIYVITQEDIRRSGHTSIPEILRMAPGLHVARINANTWAIAARGFNGRFNNKMLVMIDGRTIFSSLFSGVYWDVQDLRIEDIEKIEVIRGPGGTMWGANAVNGVINIITKDAASTLGSDLSVVVGNEDRAILSYRYGFAIGEDDYARVYVKGFQRDTSQSLAGGDHPDDWNQFRTGFRADWQEEDGTFTFQGDLYQGTAEETDVITEVNPPPNLIFNGDFDTYGGNLLARWMRPTDSGGDRGLQIYYDVTHRSSDLYDDDRNTLDLDYQHRIPLNGAHELLWGLGYRWISSEFSGSTNFDLDRSERNDQLFSAFVQDEITLREDLRMTIGTKFQHNDYTGYEVQPSIRATWIASEESTVWAAVSRAVRTPAQIQHDLIQVVAQTVGPSSSSATTLFGNDDLGSDELLAYEIGWRFRPFESVYIDATAFYNDFDAADNFTLGTVIDLGGGNFVVPIAFDNDRQAEVWGAEVSIDIDVTDSWKIRSGLSYIDLQFDTDSVTTPIQPRSDDEEPNWVANLRSHWSITRRIGFDMGIYAVDDLDDLNVDGYTRVDAHLSYRPSADLELAIGMQNITDQEHQEFASGLLATASEIEQSFYFYLRWQP